MAGYSPASTLQSNLPQSTVVYHDKRFIANLKAETPYIRCAERRELPMNSGNQLRMYMYQTFGANTAQAPEGTVSSGITPSVLTTTATIGQYADYVNLSDLARDTAIDATLENIQKEMAYRLALSLSTVLKTTVDGANSIDSSVQVQKGAASPFNRTDITTNVQSMRGRNIQPFDRAKNAFAGIIHPFIVGDILNDASNNSLVDILKRTVEGQMKLEELPSGNEGDMMDVLYFGGACFYESSLVTSTANYKSSGNTALRTYLFGENGVISISLGAKEGSKIGDGDWRNIKLYMISYGEPDRSDPSGLIGGSTSYNVKWTTSLPPDVTMRLRTIDAVSNVT